MEFTQIQEKRCSKCRETKPRSAFGKNRASPSGINYSCKDCDRRASLARRQTHGDVIAVQRKQHRLARPEVFAARNSASYAANKEQIKVEKRAHRAANTEAYSARQRKRGQSGVLAAYSQAYQSNKIQAIPGWADQTATGTMYAKAKEWSAILGVDLEVDHAVPLRSKLVCGLHVHANLQLLAANINQSKEPPLARYAGRSLAPSPDYQLASIRVELIIAPALTSHGFAVQVAKHIQRPWDDRID